MEHGEEDGVAEAMEAEEVLVEEEDADVGEVPGGDNGGGEDARGEREGVVVLPDLRRRGRRNVEELVGGGGLEAGVAAPSRRPRLRFHHLN